MEKPNMKLEEDVIYEPVMQLTADGRITFVLKDTSQRVVADVTAQVSEALRRLVGGP